MIKKILVLFILYSTNIFPQNLIKGKVSEVSGDEIKPLFGANIYVMNSSKGTISDSNGKFQLVIENSNDFYLIASFVGYFPSDKPKYSCIIVLNKPNKSKGFYGNKVAAPVFKRIAEKIFSKYPKVEEYDLNELNENIRFSKIEIKNSSSHNKIVSNGT